MIVVGYEWEIFFESKRLLNIQSKAMGNWIQKWTTTIVWTPTKACTATPNHKDGEIEKKCVEVAVAALPIQTAQVKRAGQETDRHRS